MMTINEVLNKQRAFFESGVTRDIKYRKMSLTKLYNGILANQKLLEDALQKDLGKSAFESEMCEIRLTLSEISYMKKHLRNFVKPQRVKTPIAHFLSYSRVISSPYGNVLIMSPWNYPVLLTLEPLVDAISAGNTAIIKPSAYAPNVSSVIKKLITEIFNEEYIAVIEGGRKENESLLSAKFDYIFFTGSVSVGKEVMKRASENLTPITLELGGKSPAIVLKDANIKLAARRIVFGKYLNCGQTCVAPDYILVEKEVKQNFVEEVKKEIIKQFGNNPLENNSYGKIINEKHFNRLCRLIDASKVIVGGKVNKGTLKIEPTLMNNITMEDNVMQEEIFGPIMPIIEINNSDEAIKFVKSMSHPLALYIFTNSKREQKRFTTELGFGGGCINDTIVHLATSSMGFGGFGESGMGAYHGKAGFNTFSHKKSILKKVNWIDLPIRYQPYSAFKKKLIELFLK